MKLIFCPKCNDVVNLIVNQKRACMCGLSWGQYTDETNALIGGHAIPFGINNYSFSACLNKATFTFEGFFYNNEITTPHIRYENETKPNHYLKFCDCESCVAKRKQWEEENNG